MTLALRERPGISCPGFEHCNTRKRRALTSLSGLPHIANRPRLSKGIEDPRARALRAPCFPHGSPRHHKPGRVRQEERTRLAERRFGRKALPAIPVSNCSCTLGKVTARCNRSTEPQWPGQRQPEGPEARPRRMLAPSSALRRKAKVLCHSRRVARQPDNLGCLFADVRLITTGKSIRPDGLGSAQLSSRSGCFQYNRQGALECGSAGGS